MIEKCHSKRVSETALTRGRQTGVTLMELIIVVVMVALLAAMAGPSFTGTVARSQVSSVRDGLASAMQYARSEALKRKDIVAICPSSDQDSCAGTNDWQVGWIMFADQDNSGDREAGEALLQVQYSENSVTTYSSGGPLIAFDRLGRVTSGEGEFSFCHPKQETVGRQIMVSVTGSIDRQHETIGGC